MRTRSDLAPSPTLSTPAPAPAPAPAEAAESTTTTPAPADPIRILWTGWREAAGTDAPTLNQLLQGTVVRVDVDAAAGYVAVTTGEDTYHAIGVRQDLVVPLVAVLTKHTDSEIAALLAKGPAKIGVNSTG